MSTRITFIFSLVLALVGISSVSTALAAVQPILTQPFAFICNYSPVGQLCQQDWIIPFTLDTAGSVSATYKVAELSDGIVYIVHSGQTRTAGHCSSVRVHAYVDGQLAGTTPFLGWSGGTNQEGTWGGDPLGRPLLAELLGNLSLSAGNHTLSLKAEGTPGGCNTGNLISWGGKVVITQVAPTPTPTPVSQCSDGQDNDNDGKVDMDDPGCASPTDNDESNTLPQCSDGKDNDGDGKIDNADPGCHTDGDVEDGDDSYNPQDNNEVNGQCSDGKDNDGDKLIDRADPDCHTDGNPNDGDDTFDGNRDENAKQTPKQPVPIAVPVTAKTGFGLISPLTLATLTGGMVAYGLRRFSK